MRACYQLKTTHRKCIDLITTQCRTDAHRTCCNIIKLMNSNAYNARTDALHSPGESMCMCKIWSHSVRMLLVSRTTFTTTTATNTTIGIYCMQEFCHAREVHTRTQWCGIELRLLLRVVTSLLWSPSSPSSMLSLPLPVSPSSLWWTLHIVCLSIVQNNHVFLTTLPSTLFTALKHKHLINECQYTGMHLSIIYITNIQQTYLKRHNAKSALNHAAAGWMGGVLLGRVCARWSWPGEFLRGTSGRIECWKWSKFM